MQSVQKKLLFSRERVSHCVNVFFTVDTSLAEIYEALKQKGISNDVSDSDLSNLSLI